MGSQDLKDTFQDEPKFQPVTVVFLILVSILFVLTFIDKKAGTFGGGFGAFFDFGVLNRSKVLNGEMWRIFTNNFLHIGIDHWIGNLYFIGAVGTLVETVLGSRKTFFILFWGGTIGAVFSIIAGVESSVGASDCGFALLAAIVAYGMINNELAQLVGQFQNRKGIFTFFAMLYLSAMLPRVNNAAHIGGAIGGALYIVYIFRNEIYRKFQTKDEHLNLTASFLSTPLVKEFLSNDIKVRVLLISIFMTTMLVSHSVTFFSLIHYISVGYFFYFLWTENKQVIKLGVISCIIGFFLSIVPILIVTFLVDPSSRGISSSDGNHLVFLTVLWGVLGLVNIANLFGILVLKKKLRGPKKL